MKKYLLALLSSLALTTSLLAHGGGELGPNGGRLLEFSKDESMHGEVTVKDGHFEIALLDKAHKPVALADQTLSASGGPSGKAEKLTVEKKDGKFVLPVVKDGEWLILQYKNAPDAKPITARLQYDLEKCGKCKNPEWLCKCTDEKEEKKK